MANPSVEAQPSVVEVAAAQDAAQLMQALSSPTRVRILDRLRQAACSVGELAAAVEMDQAAVSNHLRLLRHLALVTGERRGRYVIYALHDEHVAQLLEQVLEHVAHAAPGAGAARDTGSGSLRHTRS